MLQRRISTITLSFILICSYPTATIALDWTGWLIGGKSVETVGFWDKSQTKVYEGPDKAKAALIENLSSNDDIMKVDLDSEGNAEGLTISKIYTYSPSDFKVYEKKVPDYAQEQELLGQWINKLVKADPNDRRFVSATDKFFRHLEPIGKNQAWLAGLQRELLATRLGIEPEVLVDHPDFEAFVKANYLYKHLSYHNQKVEVNSEGMPELMVMGVMKPWSEIKDNVKVDSKGKLTNYFYTSEGLVPGQPSTEVVPFKKVDPNLYHHQYVLEVVSIDTFPPHNWIRLVNPEGDFYSIGYWGNTPISDLISAAKHLKPEEGHATSPDLMEIAGDPDKIVTTPIKITQEQFDETLAYIRDYQQKPGKYQILSIGGENCATFVRNLTDRLGIKVQSSSWYRPFNNPYDVMAWQKTVDKWRNNEVRKLSDPSAEERAEVEYALPP